MKNRLSRLLKVLEWYPQHSGAVDVDALALQLQTTPATIRRDLRDLREAGAFDPAERNEATAPAVGEAAGVGELLLGAEPANDVEADEAHSDDALLAMYVGARFLASEGNEAQGEAAARVLRTVQDGAGEALRRRMAEADVRFRFGPRSGERKVRLAVAQAIAERRVLRVRYRGEHDAEARVREVEPFLQFFAHDRWVFMAWCRAAGDVRQFRHERCEEVALTDAYFSPRQGLDVSAWLPEQRARSRERRVPAVPATGAPRRTG